MNTRIYGLLAGLLLASVAWAGDCCCPHCQRQVPCCYQDVVVPRCKLVPETKPIKKTVYDCKCVPVCIPKFPCECYCDKCKGGDFAHCSGGNCPTCQEACVGCKGLVKKVLVKKEITVGEICTYKCVIENVVERVPVPCCHCGKLCTQHPAALLGPSPSIPAPAPTPVVDPAPRQ